MNVSFLHIFFTFTYGLPSSLCFKRLLIRLSEKCNYEAISGLKRHGKIMRELVCEHAYRLNGLWIRSCSRATSLECQLDAIWRTISSYLAILPHCERVSKPPRHVTNPVRVTKATCHPQRNIGARITAIRSQLNANDEYDCCCDIPALLTSSCRTFDCDCMRRENAQSCLILFCRWHFFSDTICGCWSSQASRIYATPIWAFCALWKQELRKQLCFLDHNYVWPYSELVHQSRKSINIA